MVVKLQRGSRYACDLVEGLASHVDRLWKTDNSEDEMVISRILFLSTYDTTMDFEKLINENSLGNNINNVSGDSAFCFIYPF